MAFAAESFEASMVVGLRYRMLGRGLPPLPSLWDVEGGGHRIGPAFGVTEAGCERRVLTPDDGSGRGDAESAEETAALHIKRGVCTCGYVVYTSLPRLMARLPVLASERRGEYDALLIASVTAAYERAWIGPFTWRVLAVRPETLEFYPGYPARLPAPAEQVMRELLRNYVVREVVIPPDLHVRVVTDMPRRTCDGQLDISECPTCGGPTVLEVYKPKPEPLSVWRCDACRCAWQQQGYRDAVRVALPATVV